jgi:hypothetical protein
MKRMAIFADRAFDLQYGRGIQPRYKSSHFGLILANNEVPDRSVLSEIANYRSIFSQSLIIDDIRRNRGSSEPEKYPYCSLLEGVLFLSLPEVGWT